MTQDEMKRQVAQKVLEYFVIETEIGTATLGGKINWQIVPGDIIGVGTGSTTNFFIDALGAANIQVGGAVASSNATAERLKKNNIRVLDFNEVLDVNALTNIAVYVDGADESDHNLNLIKGGGGALTREKIIASAAEKFICIADETKLVGRLGKFPLPVEVIPMAVNFVKREIAEKTSASNVDIRENYQTDNGNLILDVKDLEIRNPAALERILNNIPGVVENGIFANRPADILLLGTKNGVKIQNRADG